jgi:carbonic anhydrase
LNPQRKRNGTEGDKKMARRLYAHPKTSALVLAVTMIVLSLWTWGTSTPTDGVMPSPEEALQRLQAGNARFVGGKCTHPRVDAKRLVETADKGQHPFATVITCSDSRVPVEVLFDQGIGDVFVIRVAGNVCDTDEVGSIEYGVDHLETPLFVVLGHTHCGAVTAVTTEAQLHGSIPPLVDNILPAVKKAAAMNPHLSKEELVPEAIKANCWQSIEDLFKASPATRDRVKAGKLKVVAAIYNIRTGKVGWLGSHPDQDRLLAVATAPSETHQEAKDNHNVQESDPIPFYSRRTATTAPAQSETAHH